MPSAGSRCPRTSPVSPPSARAQHHRHAERRHHARLPHALAAGVDVDVGLAGAVLDGDGQDGQWGEDDDGVGPVRHARFVPLAGTGQSAGVAVGVGRSSEVSARAAAASRPTSAVRIASGWFGGSCSMVPSPGCESPGRASVGSGASLLSADPPGVLAVRSSAGSAACRSDPAGRSAESSGLRRSRSRDQGSRSWRGVPGAGAPLPSHVDHAPLGHGDAPSLTGARSLRTFLES